MKRGGQEEEESRQGLPCLRRKDSTRHYRPENCGAGSGGPMGPGAERLRHTGPGICRELPAGVVALREGTLLALSHSVSKQRGARMPLLHGDEGVVWLQ